MQKIRWLFLVVGIALALMMSLQNNEETNIRLLWFEQALPLSVLLLSTTGIGFLLGALMTASMLRSRAKAAEKRAKEAEKKAKTGPSEPPPDKEPAGAESELLG